MNSYNMLTFAILTFNIVSALITSNNNNNVNNNNNNDNNNDLGSVASSVTVSPSRDFWHFLQSGYVKILHNSRIYDLNAKLSYRCTKKRRLCSQLKCESMRAASQDFSVDCRANSFLYIVIKVLALYCCWLNLAFTIDWRVEYVCLRLAWCYRTQKLTPILCHP